MKVNNVVNIAFLVVAIVLVITGVTYYRVHYGSLMTVFANDFKARHAEILCAHQGVNSFHVWSRDVELPGFRPHGRPDKPNVEKREGVLTVHAYPPWHVAYFYFLGWMPFKISLALMLVLFGLCIAYIIKNSFSIAARRSALPSLVAGLSLILITKDAIHCFVWMNYSVMLLALFVLMLRLLERGRQIPAGICWAMMMLKPQIAVMFFWPLVFERRYKTIVTAVSICVAGTFLMSLIYNESMFALIAQIPQIGAPYGSGEIVDKLAPIFGRYASVGWMVVCFLICGVLCFLLRGSDQFLVRCAPVAVLIPIWTYSIKYDHVFLWIWYMVVFQFVFAHGKRCWASFAVLLLFYLLCRAVVASQGIGLFDACVVECFSNVAKFGPQVLNVLLLMVYAASVVRKSKDDFWR